MIHSHDVNVSKDLIPVSRISFGMCGRFTGAEIMAFCLSVSIVCIWVMTGHWLLMDGKSCVCALFVSTLDPHASPWFLLFFSASALYVCCLCLNIFPCSIFTCNLSHASVNCPGVNCHLFLTLFSATLHSNLYSWAFHLSATWAVSSL